MDARILRAAALLSGLALTGCRVIQGLGDLSFGSGGAGGGGAIGVEDCSNGDDDDGDGQIDCADLDCGAEGYACVAAPPGGWSGPVALYEGPFADPVPPCPDLYPDLDYQGDTGPAPQAATCEECTCAATEITCAVSLASFANGSCKGSGAQSAPLTPGSCVALDPSASSLRLSNPTTTAQACEPSGGTANVPPLVRATSGIACGAFRRSGGCSAGEICAPRPRAPFREARCISRDGATSCPAAFPEQHVLAQIKDDRGCSPCACDAPAAPACAATTTLFSDAACGAAIASLPNDDSCVASMAGSAMAAITGSGSASCVPKGGAPKGTVTTVSQATICCLE